MYVTRHESHACQSDTFLVVAAALLAAATTNGDQYCIEYTGEAKLDIHVQLKSYHRFWWYDDSKLSRFGGHGLFTLQFIDKQVPPGTLEIRNDRQWHQYVFHINLKSAPSIQYWLNTNDSCVFPLRAAEDVVSAKVARRSFAKHVPRK